MNNLPDIKKAFMVWQRNFDIYKTYYVSSMVGNIGDPIITLFGVGVGLGALINDVNGLSYLAFLAPGMIAASAMSSASYECTFGVYTRMVEQQVYDGILTTPLQIEDIVLGELLWGATKSLLSSSIIMVVIILAGLFDNYAAIPMIMLNMFMLGISFSAIAISVSAVAKSYEFFHFFFVLLVTPLTLFSGIFFPVDRLPEWFYRIFLIFPTPHAVNINRYLFHGGDGNMALVATFYLALFTPLVILTAIWLVRRRVIPR